MILTQQTYNTESSGLLAEKFFEIKDLGMIFEILRSKLYSNPVLAVCREISCNARDAHREVGKFDLPIEIHLPHGLDPNFKVKDFGPGISPDRIENVFSKYTASTKREDNIQTGFFGLGAKSPWATTDSFTITTIVDGTKYQYVCYIDETKVGKIALLNKVITDESNGTEISIPVKPLDFNFFKQWTEQACRHWEVRPTITGSQIKWTEINKVIEGNNWAIINNNDSGYYGSYARNAKLVIDGIEYPLELETLKKYADIKLIECARGTFVMYFGVGELTLSANREQIYWDKRTQDKISSTMKEVIVEIKKQVEDKLNTIPNLWDANVYYRKTLTSAFNNLQFLGQLTWKTIPLHNNYNGYLEVKCGVYSFTRGKYSRKNGTDPNKLTRSVQHGLEFKENSQLWINDLPIKDPTPKHLKKAFDNDPKLNCIQIICPNDSQSEKDLNAEIHLDQMFPKKLSSIAKASPRTYTPAASRLLIFKFDTNACAFRQVSYDAMEEDTNSKVLCTLVRELTTVRMAFLDNNKKISNSALDALIRYNPQTSIYGLDKDTDSVRIKEEFSDFKALDTFINEKVLNNIINYVEIKYAYRYNYHIDDNILRCEAEIRKSIKNKNSLYLTRLDVHRKFKKLNENDKSLLDIYESANGPISENDISLFLKNNADFNIENINKMYIKKYPLLGLVTNWNYWNNIEHIIQYVNLIDQI